VCDLPKFYRDLRSHVGQHPGCVVKMYRFLDSLSRSFFDIMQRSAATDEKLTATPTNYTSSACLRLGLTRHVPINWYWPPSKLGSIELRLVLCINLAYSMCTRLRLPTVRIKQVNLAGITRLDRRQAVFQHTHSIDHATRRPRKRPSTLALAPSRQHVVD
jgi:hypothetical protein